MPRSVRFVTDLTEGVRRSPTRAVGYARPGILARWPLLHAAADGRQPGIPPRTAPRALAAASAALVRSLINSRSFCAMAAQARVLLLPTVPHLRYSRTTN